MTLFSSFGATVLSSMTLYACALSPIPCHEPSGLAIPMNWSSSIFSSLPSQVYCSSWSAGVTRYVLSSSLYDILYPII